MRQGQFKTRFLQQLPGLAACFLALSGFAQDAGQPEFRTGVMLAPSFMGYSVSQEIEGAKSTVIVPARIGRSGLEVIGETLWTKEEADWESWMSESKKSADQLVEEMEIEWSKDENEVFLYASIQSENPLLSSVILSEKFLPIFKERFGASVLVVIPNRSTIFVFPRFASKLDDYGGALANRYRESVSKVSLEIFEVDEKGCRVVGVIEN